MSKFFCITGPGRCGTVWLKHALATCPGVSVHHDLFAVTRLWRDLANLARTEGEHVGTISGHARQSIPFIEERLHPRWAFLWREPSSLVRSHVDIALHINPAVADWPPERLIQQTAHVLFGDMELSLRQFERLEIDVRHFWMPRYTTPEGFAEVCRWLGVEYGGHALPGPMHSLPKRALPVENWTAPLRRFVLDSFASLPLLSTTYREVSGEWL